MFGVLRRSDSKLTKIDLTVVLSQGQQRAVGVVVDWITCDGTNLLFEGSGAPEVAVAETVDLEINSNLLDVPVSVQAIVHNRSEAETGRIYGFRFLDPIAVLSSLPEELRRPLNHRMDFRVQPDPSAPIEVTVVAPTIGVRSMAQLADISTSGMSVSLKSDLERELSGVRNLSFSMRLPPSLELLSVQGEVRYRRLDSDGVRYGIEMNSRVDDDFDVVQQCIRTYIRARQRQIHDGFQ